MRVRVETNYIEMSHHCYFPFQHFFSNFETVPFFFCDFCLDRTKWCILRNQRNEGLKRWDVNSAVGMGLVMASPVAGMGLVMASPVAGMGLVMASPAAGMGLGMASPAAVMNLGRHPEVVRWQTERETFYDQPLLALREEILIRMSWWPSNKIVELPRD